MPNELFILDAIGSSWFEEGVTTKSVRDELAKLDKKERLTVYIDSPGGDVFQGVAIRSLLSQWAAGVDVRVIGLAASAASFIATVGETVSMAEGSMIMVHDPWTIAIGNAAEMTKAASKLEQIADNIVGAYASKSGKSAEEVRAVMLAETWFSPDKAIEFGLADEKTAEKARAIVIPQAFGFKHPPQAPEPPKQRATNKLAAMERQLDLARLI
jgi:ATP-dependent Clp protease protease subunit